MSKLGNKFIKYASEGNAKEVKRLLPEVSDQCHWWALNLSSENGHVECVKLLIPYCDSKYYGDMLILSANNSRFECMNLLSEAMRNNKVEPSEN